MDVWGMSGEGLVVDADRNVDFELDLWVVVVCVDVDVMWMSMLLSMWMM